MVGRAVKATKAERERMARLKSMACVACVIEASLGNRQGCLCGYPEVHHLISGNRRRGHIQTVTLGSWHHRGVRVGVFADLFSQAEMRQCFGPSLALQSKAFRERYGTDDSLLALTNAKLLEQDNG